MAELTPAQVNAAFAELAARTERVVRCQCDQHRVVCRGRAEVVAELHLVGNCRGPEANEWGNRVELLCLPCAQHLWREAEVVAARYRAAGARTGLVPQCGSCGAPASAPSDLLRVAKRMPGGVQ